MEKKICSKCGKEKELVEFYKDKKYKDGYKPKCKECNKIHVGICEVCEEEFRSEKKNQKFCSARCQGIYNQKRISLNCDYCGKIYEITECLYKGRESHYCSKECKDRGHSEMMLGAKNPRYNSRLIKCDQCGKDILRNESQIDERNFCDIKCYSEYRKINYSKENHSNWEGGDLEVSCSCCGKKIFKKKSEIRNNNYCSVECMGTDRARLYAGENNSNWCGGVTNVSEYLRHNINEWKLDTIKKYDFKCDISGEENNLIIHHLYNYSDILKETFDLLDIPILKSINEYTDLELEKIKEKCLELHYKHGLGVCITEDLHKEFHSRYGKKNNTNEQYYEFKEYKLNKKDLKTAY